MPFCPKCGANNDENAKFCQKCGESFNKTDYDDSQFLPSDIEKNKGISALCYLGILLLIPLLIGKDSKFVKFHLNQGLVLLIFEIAVNFLFNNILSFVRQFSYIAALADIFFFVLIIIGIVNVINGKAKKLPIIGEITIIK